MGRSLRPAETVMLERDIWKIAFKSLRKDPAYPPLARFGPTLDGHNSGPFPLHSCKFELYPAYLTPSVSSVPQILRRYSWTAWPLPPAHSLFPHKEMWRVSGGCTLRRWRASGWRVSKFHFHPLRRRWEALSGRSEGGGTLPPSTQSVTLLTVEAQVTMYAGGA